jgi:hypothetical protein
VDRRGIFHHFNDGGIEFLGSVVFSAHE